MTSFVTQASTDAHRNHQKSFEINIISKRLGLMTKHLMYDFVYQPSFIKFQTKRIYIDIDISVFVCHFFSHSMESISNRKFLYLFKLFSKVNILRQRSRLKTKGPTNDFVYQTFLLEFPTKIS